MQTLDLRYPIGRFALPERLDSEARRTAIEEIAMAPTRLRGAVAGLDEVQLDTPYREGGWSPRIVVHHVPDSHMNAFIRTKLALAEEHPRIKPYDQAVWAQLPDVAGTPIETSLRLLEALHERWVVLWKSLGPQDFTRTFDHPEMGAVSLDQLLALYAWHGRHHTAQISSLRERRGW
jgi:uncharacterized damage-inducible protein DinB